LSKLQYTYLLWLAYIFLFTYDVFVILCSRVDLTNLHLQYLIYVLGKKYEQSCVYVGRNSWDIKKVQNLSDINNTNFLTTNYEKNFLHLMEPKKVLKHIDDFMFWQRFIILKQSHVKSAAAAAIKKPSDGYLILLSFKM
jgi:hypothetical protein